MADGAVNAIETRGFSFTRTMVENSEEIARQINEASQNATGAVTQSLADLTQTVAQSADSASESLTSKMFELRQVAKAAIDESKQTTTIAVTEMMETHSMLRADTTTLFERLREANVLLQEVLSGAHDNMSTLEQTLVSRVSDFVSTMNKVMESSGQASNEVEQHVTAFHRVTSKVLGELSQLSGQFEAQGQALASAADLIERSNRHTEETVSQRRESINALVANLDTRSNDLDQRLKRFSSLLEESLEASVERAREIARIVAETSTEGARSVHEQFDRIRATTEEERRRTSEMLTALFHQSTTESHSMFTESADRFAEVVQGLKQMTSEMQQELDSTRNELRRGIFELPQETADNAAQMRRVIIDQIEALAELNRIVARHGRGVDAADPMQRGRGEPVGAGAVSRAEQPPPREMASLAPPPPPAPQRRTDAPALSPNGQGAARGGWLSDLLSRASQDLPAAQSEASYEPVRNDERPARHTIESLDSLAVDIARMIDHDAAAELWDRYNRGERNVFTRKLYTLQGQRAFDEIRKKYRSDREFKQTVDRYVMEFERLLEEVSQDDRGQVVARTYLTSETGKVYTMLAHAAGRFD
jgi:hypothetical protein